MDAEADDISDVLRLVDEWNDSYTDSKTRRLRRQQSALTTDGAPGATIGKAIDAPSSSKGEVGGGADGEKERIAVAPEDVVDRSDTIVPASSGSVVGSGSGGVAGRGGDGGGAGGADAPGKFCIECGKRIPVVAKFCPECGGKQQAVGL